MANETQVKDNDAFGCKSRNYAVFTARVKTPRPDETSLHAKHSRPFPGTQL